MEKKHIACIFGFCILVIGLLPILCFAEDSSSVDMIGVRVGIWSALKAENMASNPLEENSTTKGYMEIFISSRLRKRFAREISLGWYDRGNTGYSVGYHSPYGYDYIAYYNQRVAIFPLSLGYKFYPLSPTKNYRWQPYISAGVGLVCGLEKGAAEYKGSYSNTQFTFGWFVGGGLECRLGLIFGHVTVLGFNLKYRGVNFEEEIGGLKDYSGLEATLGLSSIL